MINQYDLSVMHIGSGSYNPFDNSHSTYNIWKTLSSSFRRYDVFGRSTGTPAKWSDGQLTIHLQRRWMARELEYLWTQFLTVPLGCRLKPNTIVCQSPVGGGLAALLIARHTGAGVLMEIHGNEYLTPSQKWSRNWVIQEISRYALNRATTIRVLSEGMRERFFQLYGNHLQNKVHVLPPRVDLNRFNFKPRTADKDGRLRLIMIGTVNSNKGQLRLIKALNKTNIPITLHIVGDGPDLEKCSAIPSTDQLKIFCHGYLTHAEISELLGSVDIFLMYSRTEGTPRAMMEAMACGLPVVTTNAGFCSDVVKNGSEGFVLGDDPDKDLLDILDRLQKDPAMRQKMGNAARRRAENDYDSRVLYERYRALIAETAEK